MFHQLPSSAKLNWLFLVLQEIKAMAHLSLSDADEAQIRVSSTEFENNNPDNLAVLWVDVFFSAIGRNSTTDATSDNINNRKTRNQQQVRTEAEVARAADVTVSSMLLTPIKSLHYFVQFCEWISDVCRRSRRIASLLRHDRTRKWQLQHFRWREAAMGEAARAWQQLLMMTSLFFRLVLRTTAVTSVAVSSWYNRGHFVSVFNFASVVFSSHWSAFSAISLAIPTSGIS